MPSRDPVEKALQHDLCAGCGLCEGVAGKERVELRLDPAGFLRPVRKGELLPAEAATLCDCCPGLNVTHRTLSPDCDPVWGTVESVRVAAAADPELRRTGSSGGVLTALQLHLLESGQVDYVVATGGSPDGPIGTGIRICRNRGDLLEGAGSRYAPSAPLRTIGKLLDAPGRFAFVGKPCDTAALRRLAAVDPRVGEKVPFLLSFLCAGVPSLLGTHEVIRRLGAPLDEVAGFRYRGDGWPGLTRATLKDGSCRSMSYQQSWGEILGKHLQWRCKLCPDGTGEAADIACGDAWHMGADGSPDFSEHEGRSFALLRNARGESAFREAVAAGAVRELGRSSLAAVEAVQFHQGYRKKTMLARYLAQALLLRGFPRYNAGLLAAACRRAGGRSLASAFAGSLLRAMGVR